MFIFFVSESVLGVIRRTFMREKITIYASIIKTPAHSSWRKTIRATNNVGTYEEVIKG